MTTSTPTTSASAACGSRTSPAYGIPLLERDEFVAYAAWHGDVRATR